MNMNLIYSMDRQGFVMLGIQDSMGLRGTKLE